MNASTQHSDAGRSRRGRPRARTGFALVAVLWVVVVAGLMLLGLQKASRGNLATAHNELECVRAHWLARAGVEQALAVLDDDNTYGRSSDGAGDTWYSDEDSFKNVRLVGGTFSVLAGPHASEDPRAVRYGLIDHCARANLNTIGDDELKKLCDLAAWQVESILDWRDKDSNARTAGAETLFYHRLKYPYLIRNGPLRTVREALLVRGINPETFTGEDANLNGVLDENENDQRVSYPDDDGDDRLAPGLGGLATVYSYERNRDAYDRKRININTADKKKLMDELKLTDALAQAVVDKKPGKASKGKGKRLSSLMGLLDVKAKRGSSNRGKKEEGKVKEFTLKWLANNLDSLTLTDDVRLVGRVNVNTAPTEVLRTLPKMTKETVHKILSRQVSGKGPLAEVSELLTDKILTEEQFKAVAERLTVRSAVLEIRSRGVTKWGICREITAIVDRGEQPTKTLYWYQSE